MSHPSRWTSALTSFIACQLLNSNRYGDARGALREIQERNNDIKKIEKTLTELAQMFNEMSMLVEQQDETLAVIENHAQQVDTDMEAGLKHTEEAVVKARKARRKKWICFWISLLILAIVVAVVSSSSPSRPVLRWIPCTIASRLTLDRLPYIQVVGVICGGQGKC
jgi:t-SNARE complex subunit (syntaxin)